MSSEARQKNMEKLNKAKKCLISGPQNLGVEVAPGPPRICTCLQLNYHKILIPYHLFKKPLRLPE